MYRFGEGVSKDQAKRRHYHEQAAIAGDSSARLNLGCVDADNGNFHRAIKHWLIAASSGNMRAINDIKRAVILGHATRDHYAQALQGYKQYLDEVKSEQR
jgi:TPR repeat protein